jgi:hypothetical protein
MKIKTDISGRFLSGKIIPVYQPWPGGVKYDPNGRVIRKIRDLTTTDFPDGVINVSEKGEITYK